MNNQKRIARKLLSLQIGTLVSSTNNTDRHDITEILLKVALNTIHQPTNGRQQL
jgi:hypothetical protein